MTHSPEVSATVAGGIGTVTFGGTKGNSLPAALLADLAARIAETARRDEVRVIVIQSVGQGPFCAGASFDELAMITSAEQGKRFFLGFAGVMLAMIRAPKPVVVRVHGKVVGGGVGIVAAADHAIALASASVRLSELAVGIGPFVIGPAVERRIGPGPFGAMALDAGWRDAAWAERHGLYAKVCDTPEALDAAVEAQAQQLAAANPEATAQIKAILWQGTDSWERVLDERAAMSGRLVLSAFTKRAIAGFARPG
ncbi:MAG TPA: enoyl-CoA hydratase-related protein [Gemmatimonadaceae bacterium]|nr:enoyl-CoA hydratase-related protein [Gemmatimonadaceae bacterium]